MTFWGRLVAAFPILFLAADLALFTLFVKEPSPALFVFMIFSIYCLPVVFFRLHNLFFPLKNSVTDLSKPLYSPWWTGHQIQMKYIAWPSIEVPLRLVPGLYSAWLRMWGSQIGKQVYWTPRIEVVDRSLLKIGDHVVVGHLAGFCSHVISPQGKSLILIVNRIQIGSGAFIGAESRLGPGTRVQAGQILKAHSILYKGSGLK